MPATMKPPVPVLPELGRWADGIKRFVIVGVASVDETPSQVQVADSVWSGFLVTLICTRWEFSSYIVYWSPRLFS